MTKNDRYDTACNPAREDPCSRVCFYFGLKGLSRIMAIYVTVTYFRPGSCTHLKISVSFIVLSFVSVTFSGRKKIQKFLG